MTRTARYIRTAGIIGENNPNSGNNVSTRASAPGWSAAPHEAYLYPQIGSSTDWRPYGEPIEVTVPSRSNVKSSTAGRISEDTSNTDVRKVFPESLNTPLVAAFITQIDIRRDGPGGDVAFGLIDGGKIIKNADSSIREILKKDFGISDPGQVTGERSQPSQADAHRGLQGECTLSETRDVTLRDGDTETIELTGTVPIRVSLSTWEVEESEDYLLVGGLPGEPYLSYRDR